MFVYGEITRRGRDAMTYRVCDDLSFLILSFNSPFRLECLIARISACAFRVSLKLNRQ